jgi:hypothetical protein
LTAEAFFDNRAFFDLRNEVKEVAKVVAKAVGGFLKIKDKSKR